MNVLITGGLGVNGSWVTRKLVDRGLRPIVVDRRADFSLLGGACAAGIDFVEGDIDDAVLMGALMRERKVNAVIHMAAVIGHGAVDREPRQTFDLNAYATVKLLDEARKTGVSRFVFTSSRAVYGGSEGAHAAPTYAPIFEDHPTRPQALYDVCKVTCEGVGRAFAAAYGMEFISLRFATIYGPGKTLRHKSFGVVSRIIEGPLHGDVVEIERGGDQRDDLIFAGDAADGIVLTLFAKGPLHSEYNISTGVLHSLGDVASVVRKQLPAADIRIGPGLNYFGDGPNYAGLLDNSRARKDLNFKPSTDLSHCIEQYYRAMREIRLPPFQQTETRTVSKGRTS